MSFSDLSGIKAFIPLTNPLKDAFGSASKSGLKETSKPVFPDIKS